MSDLFGILILVGVFLLVVAVCVTVGRMIWGPGWMSAPEEPDDDMENMQAMTVTDHRELQRRRVVEAIAAGTDLPPHARGGSEVEPMVTIELSPEEARALWQWFNYDTDVHYWEIKGLAAVYERLKSWTKYEEWW